MSSEEQKNVGMKKGPIDLIASGSGGRSMYVGCASVPPKFPGDPMDWVTREFDDHIKDLGDRIVSLSPSEANDLNRYLKTKGVDK